MANTNNMTYTLQVKSGCGEGALLQFVGASDKDAGIVVRAWLKRNTFVTKDQVELKKAPCAYKIMIQS